MPSIFTAPFRRHISVDSTPVYFREPRDDELFVMKAFSRHAAHCSSCSDPYTVFRSGKTLCPKGHQRALDVAQYVYNRSGVPHSTIDRDNLQRVQLEIPSNMEAIRSLLKAMERGLRVNRAPSVSYDRTYNIPARPATARPASSRAPSSTGSNRSSTSKLKLETAEPPAWHTGNCDSTPSPRQASIHTSPSTTSSRSSLAHTTRSRGISSSSTSSSSSVDSGISMPRYEKSSSIKGSPNSWNNEVKAAGLVRKKDPTGKYKPTVYYRYKRESSVPRSVVDAVVEAAGKEMPPAPPPKDAVEMP